MNTTTIAIFLLLLFATPILAEAPSNSTAQRIWGTSSLDVKGLFAIDYNPCGFYEAPLACQGAFAQRGKTYFDTSGWNAGLGTSTGRIATVWVEMTRGLLPQEGGGFSVTVCSDLNDNSACSNVLGDMDAVAWSYSNDGPLPPEACAKDEKDCGDPTAAVVTLCIPVDDDGSFDDIAVYLSLWVDVELESNLGTGVSEGLYDAYLTPGAYVEEC